MAFPFGWNPPSLREFIETAQREYGATLTTLDVNIEGPFGTVRPRFLERTQDGKTYHVALPHWDDDEILLEPNLIRNLCTRLNIPTEPFGVIFSEASGLKFIDPNKPH